VRKPARNIAASVAPISLASKPLARRKSAENGTHADSVAPSNA
jgi:hypothetical protein